MSLGDLRSELTIFRLVFIIDLTDVKRDFRNTLIVVDSHVRYALAGITMEDGSKQGYGCYLETL